MRQDSSYERLHTGSQIEINYIKNQLEENDIASVLRNDFESGLRAGFGGSPDQVQLFVKKQDMIPANRILENVLENNSIPEDELNKAAAASRLDKEKPVQKKAERPLIDKKPKRSPLNLVINIALIIYSLYRLYPLTQGETLPTWRIAVSGFILVFCTVALVNYFRKKA
ncbi:MAG: DUF2007 domain-containing protein [Leeuwenhoekiella sp.]